MTNLETPETRIMATVDCPLCDGPATLDTAAGILDCAGCRVVVDLAPDPQHALPLAA